MGNNIDGIHYGELERFGRVILRDVFERFVIDDLWGEEDIFFFIRKKFKPTDIWSVDELQEFVPDKES